jgi:hypothetical protein
VGPNLLLTSSRSLISIEKGGYAVHILYSGLATCVAKTVLVAQYKTSVAQHDLRDSLSDSEIHVLARYVGNVVIHNLDTFLE